MSASVDQLTSVHRRPPTASTPADMVLRYTGSSMYPRFRHGDLLEVRYQPAATIRHGHVIAFSVPGDGHICVHRVRSVTPAGLRTRGDARRTDDADLVEPRRVVGRVVAVHRGRRRIALRGRGVVCRAVVAARRAVLTRRDGVSRALHPWAEHAVSRLGRRVSPLLPDPWRPRLATFTTDAATRPRLLLGHRIIGEYDTVAGSWDVRLRWRWLTGDLPDAPIPSPPRVRTFDPPAA